MKKSCESFLNGRWKRVDVLEQNRAPLGEVHAAHGARVGTLFAMVTAEQLVAPLILFSPSFISHTGNSGNGLQERSNRRAHLSISGWSLFLCMWRASPTDREHDEPRDKTENQGGAQLEPSPGLQEIGAQPHELRGLGHLHVHDTLRGLEFVG